MNRLSGFADEAANSIDGQIEATRAPGWSCIEARGVDGVNMHDLSDADFDVVRRKLDAAGIRVNCFGSTIANWSKSVDETRAVVERAIRRLREICSRFLDAGLTPVHENCMDYGGMSWEHSLEMLAAVPGLKLVYDTGNPGITPDFRKPFPYPNQDARECYEKLRDHVVHVHIKDGVRDPETG
ncbi:MAG: sugar phosphate isomerase/epimerase, partial [Candidatus Accumulibacter sp.]|nr:sugar phosphate isomerase/epimerase [Accumulibacter sp.]